VSTLLGQLPGIAKTNRYWKAFFVNLPICRFKVAIHDQPAMEKIERFAITNDMTNFCVRSKPAISPPFAMERTKSLRLPPGTKSAQIVISFLFSLESKSRTRTRLG
jgi:hypothetical protein